MTTLSFEAPFGFRLSAASDFYAGFSPMGGSASQDRGPLELGFLLDGTFEPVTVSLTQSGRTVTLESSGTKEVSAVRRQVSRMLGLDVDGHAWLEVGKRDEAVGRLQSHFPGFFTAGFPSAYEAGVGGVLSQRTSVKQGAALRRKLSEAHGTVVGPLAMLPTPGVLLGVKAFPGVPAAKMEVLHGLALAALNGKLEAERLRSMSIEEALNDLQQIHGIGPWTSGHMLFRGACVQDGAPVSEPRVLRAFEVAMKAPEREFISRSEQWKPFRMWVCILMMRELMRVGQWAAVPEDFKRRGRRHSHS